MRKLTIYTIISLVLISFLLSPFFISDQGDYEFADAVPTRDAGEDLKLENETYRLQLNGTRYMEFDTVQLLDNSTLEIIGGTLKAKKLICRSSAVNTTLRLLDYVSNTGDSTPGLISITEGIVNVKAVNIEIRGSSITVQNGTSTIPNGEDGGYSEINLISRGSDLMVNDSEFNVRGHNGGLGEQNLFAGSGGKAYLNLGSSNGHSTMISGSELLVEGGSGGDAFASGIRAGGGGDSLIDVHGENVEIRSSIFFTKGGSGGVHSPQSQGDEGGFASVGIEADEDINVLATNIDSIDGLDSTLQQKGESRVIVISSNGKVRWDHNKPEEQKMDVLSIVNSDIFQIDASKGGAQLHQVETGNEPPIPRGSTSLEVFWWANVKVRDLYGDPLPGASVTWTIDPDPVPYPRDGSVVITDDDGNVDIEVVGRQNEDWLRYTFWAEITGGARGNSDQYRFLENQNERVSISITRMVLAISEPDFKVIQGGVLNIVGTAQPGNQAAENEVTNVTLYLDEEIIGYAEDIADGGAPPYSTWILRNWNSEEYSNGPHVLTIVGIDSSYSVRVDIDIELNDKIVNHQPSLHSVQIIDVDGPKSISPKETIEVHVDQEEEENSVLTFKVEAYDRDYISEFLGVGEGKEIVKVGIDVVYVANGATIIGKETLVVGEDDIERYNLSGGFEFPFTVNTLEKPGTSEPFEEGEYKVVFHIEDDGGLVSTFDNFIFFDLQFDFYPFVEVFIEPNIRSREDAFSTHESFTLQTPTENDLDGSNTLKVRFNFTDSSDRDDELWSSDPVVDRSWSNLRFTVEIRDPDNNREVVFGPDGRGAFFDYTFDVGNLADGEEGEFIITIVATDQQGLETELTVLARVTHNAPNPPISVVDIVTTTDWLNIEYGSVFFIFPIIAVLTILGYLGAIFFVQMRNDKDKESKMAILERKKEQDDKNKETTTIEDEVNMGIKDSKQYLEATGAGKGKDDFLKELEQAQGKGETKTEVTSGQVEPKKESPAPQQKPPTPDAPVQQAPPTPAPAAPPAVPPTPQQPAQQAPPAPPQPAPKAPPAPQAPPKAPQAAPSPPQVPPKPPQQPPAQ